MAPYWNSYFVFKTSGQKCCWYIKLNQVLQINTQLVHSEQVVPRLSFVLILLFIICLVEWNQGGRFRSFRSFNLWTLSLWPLALIASLCAGYLASLLRSSRPFLDPPHIWNLWNHYIPPLWSLLYGLRLSWLTRDNGRPLLWPLTSFRGFPKRSLLKRFILLSNKINESDW